MLGFCEPLCWICAGRIEASLGAVCSVLLGCRAHVTWSSGAVVGDGGRFRV